MTVKGKACRNCRKVIEEGSNCPNCNSTAFTTFWKGYVIIVKPEQSEIAKRMGIKTTGMHALRLSR
ncbi:MAG: transcription elongation factor subunit Spt4 [Candidatus Diapherotrites archaeon]|nr:transcription elongation factor subunit Spt4 [Candidatus Diapherotrites archaeon]